MITEQKVAHLTYKISSINDIIHPFSPENYELLTDSFVSFIDLECADIPEDVPIVLEITGLDLTSEQERIIDNAIWVHYRLHMVNTHSTLRHCRVKTAWFLLCTILSSYLLFLATNDTIDLIEQYLYIPFWFFAYRLLTYPLFDYLPTWKMQKKYRRLASMKLIFTKEPLAEISETLNQEALKETTLNYSEAMDDISNHVLFQKYFMDKEKLIMECCTQNDTSLIRESSIAGKELITDELASYLAQAEPFIDPDVPVKMIFSGKNFSEEEKVQTQNGLRRYFHLRYLDAKKTVLSSKNRILLYCIGLIIASIVLYLTDGKTDVAYHELFVIVLWFFGDYLMEFVLLGLKEDKNNVSLYQKLENMPVEFK